MQPMTKKLPLIQILPAVPQAIYHVHTNEQTLFSWLMHFWLEFCIDKSHLVSENTMNNVRWFYMY